MLYAFLTQVDCPAVLHMEDTVQFRGCNDRDVADPVEYRVTIYYSSELRLGVATEGMTIHDHYALSSHTKTPT